MANHGGESINPTRVDTLKVPGASLFVFKAAGDSETEMTVTEYGYTTEEARDLSRAGMEQCLDKMAAMFAG
jgi:hypothetical protein